MKAGKCGLCRKESSNLWQLHLAQYDSLLKIRGKSLSRDLCPDCVGKINQVVIKLAKGTSMGKAFQEAGIDKGKLLNSSPKERGASPKERGGFQNRYFNTLRVEKTLVEIASLDGNTWEGTIEGFDDYALLLKKEEGELELIFKHAMKSVRPLPKIAKEQEEQDRDQEEEKEDQEEKAI